MTPTVLVTQLEYDKAKAVFDAAESTHALRCLPAPRDEAALAEAVRQHEAAAVILGVDPYADALYDALPTGGVITRFGVGHDGVDKAKATAARLLVANTPGVLDNAAAEHTIWLIGALARHIPAMHTRLVGGTWQATMGQEVQGKTLAVLGLGGIGTRVAAMASLGLGMAIIGLCRRPLAQRPDLQHLDFALFTSDLPEAVADADFVTLHLPAIPATRHICNADFFASVKTGARFINTSRGSLVDERALFDALASGHLAAAALDVFDHEPYVPVDPAADLRTLDNVVLTPHAASTTVEACVKVANRSLANVAAGLARRFGDMDLLNPEVLAQL